MLKKIISLMLVVCMMATMAISVSADPAESAITAVISEVAQDGTFTVTFYVTPNAEAELQGYSIKVSFDKTQIAVDSSWKQKSVFGELFDMADTKQYNNTSDSFVKAVWAGSAGMINADEEKIAADATGNIPICVFKLKVVDNEANYGAEAVLTYDDVTTSLLSNGDEKIENVPASGSFEMPDNRPEMEGVSFEGKEVVYNGEAVAYPVVTGAPAGAVTKYTVDGVENAEIKNAGTYKVVATTTCAGYKKNVSEATVTVKKAPATLKIKDAAKVYGESDPTAFDATEEGLIENDTLDYTLAREAGEAVGTYAITATLGENPNYEVTVVPANFEITKKAATLKVEDATKVYDTADPAFSANAEGLVGEDTLAYELSRAAGEDVDTYEITATLGENPNYEVTVEKGTFTITKADYTKAPITVSKNVMINKEKSYEVDITSAISDYAGAAVVSAAVDVDGTIISNVTADGNVVKFDVALYAEEVEDIAKIKVTIESKNYKNFNAYINISTVDKEELTIDGVKVASKTYDAKPVVVDKAELSVEGATEVAFDKETLEYKFVGVEGTVYDSTDAPKDAGKYNLVVSVPEENENYAGSKVVAFEIAKKEAKILIDNKDKKVKAANPAFTFTTEGFVDGEAPASINFADIAVDSLAGEYDITATYDDPNYIIDIVNGKLTISKYTLKVTAPSKNVFVGGTLDISTLAATIENEDKDAALVATFKVYDGDAEVTAINTTAEKSYVTKATIEGLDTDKYDFTYVDGAIVVKKAGGRPSNTGIIKPATGGSGGGGSTSKPDDKEEDKKDDKEEDKEDSKPAASANIAIKEDAKDVNFVVADADNKFNPDVNASRNDVVAVLSAIFNVTDVKNAPEFTDSTDEAVKALAAAGVINGYEDGSFQGEKDITRAEFVKLLAAALKLEAIEGAEAAFTDIADHWAAEWVKTFVAKGYIVGYPDGTFRPEANITRAEMVVVATRVAGSVAGEAAVEFADVDASHWAYDFIMKAAK